VAVGTRSRIRERSSEIISESDNRRPSCTFSSPNSGQGRAPITASNRRWLGPLDRYDVQHTAAGHVDGENWGVDRWPCCICRPQACSPAWRHQMLLLRLRVMGREFLGIGCGFRWLGWVVLDWIPGISWLLLTNSDETLRWNLGSLLYLSFLRKLYSTFSVDVGYVMMAFCKNIVKKQSFFLSINQNFFLKKGTSSSKQLCLGIYLVVYRFHHTLLLYKKKKMWTQVKNINWKLHPSLIATFLHYIWTQSACSFGCWLIAGGWFVSREKHCWLVADKPSEQGVIYATSCQQACPKMQREKSVNHEYLSRHKTACGHDHWIVQLQ
jgi:hypothetical protein